MKILNYSRLIHSQSTVFLFILKETVFSFRQMLINALIIMYLWLSLFMHETIRQVSSLFVLDYSRTFTNH